MQLKIDEQDLMGVAFLIEANNHLSASREGLEARDKNRKKAQIELLFMVQITKEEVEEMYNEWAVEQQ